MEVAIWSTTVSRQLHDAKPTQNHIKNNINPLTALRYGQMSELLPPEQNLLPKCTQTIHVKNTTANYNGI